MSDVQVQTIRMAIDVEVRARAPRNPSLPAPDTDAELHGYEQALFALFEADPDLCAEFIKRSKPLAASKRWAFTI